MDKWSTFWAIDPAFWKQEAPPGSASPIWRLTDWLPDEFKPIYQSIIRNTDPFDANLIHKSIYVFARADGGLEIRIPSRVAAGHYYDFTWQPLQAAQLISRCDADGKPRCDTIVTVGSRNLTLCISSPDIDENLTLDLNTLVAVAAESQKEKERKLLPWKRLLTWFGRLQKLDPEGFQRVPAAWQAFLRRADFEAAIAGLTWAQIQPNTNAGGTLPLEFTWVYAQDIANALESIRFQQRLGAKPRTGTLWDAQIPTLLLRIDAATIDGWDVQSFMMMGALMEAHGYRERELWKLCERRPDLKRLRTLPEGWKLMQNDPEVQQIESHPLTRAYDWQQFAASQHRKGIQGPTPMEQATMGTSPDQEALLRQLGVPVLANPLVDDVQRAPWQIYKPYAY